MAFWNTFGRKQILLKQRESRGTITMDYKLAILKISFYQRLKEQFIACHGFNKYLQ